MKKLLKRFLCVSLALIIFCFSLISSVSAEDAPKTSYTDAELLEMGWIFGMTLTETDRTRISKYHYNLDNNSTYDSSKIVMFTTVLNNYTYIHVINLNNAFELGSDDNYTYYSTVKGATFYNHISKQIYTTNESYFTSDLSSLSNPSVVTSSSIVCSFALPKNENSYFKAFRGQYSKYSDASIESNYQSVYNNSDLYTPYGNNFTINDTKYIVSEGVLSSFSWFSSFSNSNLEIPDIDEPREKYYNLYGIDVRDIDKQGFLQWFVSNNKIEDIKDCGLDVGNDRIEYLFDFWNKYKGHPLKMLANLPFLCLQLGLTSITYDCITSVAHRLDDLYLEYEQYLSKNSSQQIEYKGPHPHWRNTDDSDADYTLTTDTTEDDTLISLLREILRTLIVLPEQISSYFSYLTVYLDSILIDFNRLLYFIDSLPAYIADSMQTKFSDDIQTIIDAINNISVDFPETPDTTINVEIPENKQTEVNNFFADYKVRLDSKIYEKLPIITQLSTLFNDLWEHCGIDVNNDGQTVQYVSSLNSVSDSGTFGPSPDSPEASSADSSVNMLLSYFPDADIDYLNSDYTEEIPSISINFMGKDLPIINFRIYAKYRDQIHAIITFIVWMFYLLSLYKSLPTIIGKVSDVYNTYSNSNSFKE